MLSMNQLKAAGHITEGDISSSLSGSERSTGKVEDFSAPTTIYSVYDIHPSTMKSPAKMEDFRQICTELCVTCRTTFLDCASVKIGIDLPTAKMYTCSLVGNPQTLTNLFVNGTELLQRLDEHCTLIETVCTTIQSEVKNLKKAMARFTRPPRFVAAPVVSVAWDNNDKDNAFQTIAQQNCKLTRLREAANKDDIHSLFGTWKIKEDTLNDDTKFHAMIKALHAYKEVVKEVEDYLYVEVAVNRELGEVYCQEHYGSTKGGEEKIQHVEAIGLSDELYEYVIIDELFFFGTPQNYEFCQRILDTQCLNRSACLEVITGL